MTSTQIRNQLVDARISRTVAGKKFEAASAAMSLAEHTALEAGSVPRDQLTPGQVEFLRALRTYNAALDEVEDLAAAQALAIACDEFEEA